VSENLSRTKYIQSTKHIQNLYEFCTKDRLAFIKTSLSNHAALEECMNV